MSLPSDINPQLLALSSGYNLTRSLRFRASAGGYLSRTNTGTVTNSSVWTWSAWVKIGYWSSGNAATLMGTGTNGGTDESSIKFVNNNLEVINYRSSVVKTRKITTQVFRDPSAWYHIVVANNSSTAIKIYVNGVEVTSFGTSTGPGADAWVLNTASQSTGIGYLTSAQNFDGQMTEINFIDGQALTPSSFGSTNALTGVWQPARYTGTYGTNGFYLPFTDNSALTTASNVGLGKDFSGNGNYWTTNNISLTAGVTYDSMTDVPTLTSATAANFAVLNPLNLYGVSVGVGTLTNGNLRAESNAGVNAYNAFPSTIAVSSGKWYYEATILQTRGVSDSIPTAVIGFYEVNTSTTTYSSNNVAFVAYISPTNSQIRKNGVDSGTLTSVVANDVIGVALDLTNLTCQFYLNGSAIGSQVTGLTAANYYAQITPVTGASQTTIVNANFGQRPFTYTPPTGFVALNTYNLPTSTIVKGNTVMDATLYTGTGATQSITNAASFKPDFVWLKSRSATTNHQIFDSVRGTTKVLVSNSTDAETTSANTITSFNSGGFTVGTNTAINTNAATYVGWQWQAGQGSTSSDTNGSITSTVSVNASAGFSVVTYTGTGVAATVGHGLGVAPQFIIVRNRSSAGYNWAVYTTTTGVNNVLFLNGTDASTAATGKWSGTNSSVFGVNTALDVNGSGSTYVAYCWTPIAGFSAFGSYTGNGSTDGPFIYTGFRPKFILIKSTTAARDWILWDTARDTYNRSLSGKLSPNLADAEYVGGTAYAIPDCLSNGFKIRETTTNINASGETHIYMAFAENPFKNSLAR